MAAIILLQYSGTAVFPPAPVNTPVATGLATLSLRYSAHNFSAWPAPEAGTSLVTVGQPLVIGLGGRQGSIATLPALISRARLEMGDGEIPFTARVQGDGLATVVEAPSKPVDSNSMTYLLVDNVGNQTQIVPSTIDPENGIVTLNNPIPLNSQFVMSGNAFRYFSDNTWQTFVYTALTQHLHNREGVDISNMPPVEDYPVAILAVIECLYALMNDAASDIDIAGPEGVSIPRHQRFEQLGNMIAMRTMQYRDLASALNVGLNRIEMMDLRRVSYRTRRLIPVYRPQEFQDTRWPYQVFTPLDTLGGGLQPDVQALFVAFQGYSYQNFSWTGSLNRNLTGYTVTAAVRRYPNALTPIAWFAVTVLDITSGQIQLQLDGDLMYFLGGARKFWDCQIINQTTGEIIVAMHGTFDAVRVGNP